jgi:hypothetical protein
MLVVGIFSKQKNTSGIGPDERAVRLELVGAMLYNAS